MIVKQSASCIDLLYNNHYLLYNLCKNISNANREKFNLIAEVYDDKIKIDSAEYRKLVSTKDITILADKDTAYIMRRSKNSYVVKLKVEDSNYTYARVLKTLSKSNMIYICFLVGDTLIVTNIDYSAGIKVLYDYVKLYFKELDDNYDALAALFNDKFVAMYMKSKNSSYENCFFDCLSTLSTSYKLVHPDILTKVKYSENASKLCPKIVYTDNKYLITYRYAHAVTKCTLDKQKTT